MVHLLTSSSKRRNRTLVFIDKCITGALAETHIEGKLVEKSMFSNLQNSLVPKNVLIRSIHSCIDTRAKFSLKTVRCFPLRNTRTRLVCLVLTTGE